MRATAALTAAQAIESKNQAEVSGLVAEAESYLKEHYDKDYLGPVTENCKRDKENAKARYQARVAELGKEHEKELARLRAEGGADLQQELKDENYVYKNKLFDAKDQLRAGTAGNQGQKTRGLRRAVSHDRFAPHCPASPSDRRRHSASRTISTPLTSASSS